jgi:glycopeptide antibiotics resistance protein
VGVLLREFGVLIPMTILSLPFGLFGWRVLAAWRRRRRPARIATVTAGMDVAIALFAVLVLMLVTMPVDGRHTSRLHLLPGSDVVTAFGTRGSLWQVAGNLVLLAPLGALLPLRTTVLRSLTRITFAAFSSSAVIETTQYLIHSGRVTSTDDVLLNTVGAVAGAGLTARWWRAAVRAIPVQMRRKPVVDVVAEAGVPRARPDRGRGVFRGELVPGARGPRGTALFGEHDRLVRECR